MVNDAILSKKYNNGAKILKGKSADIKLNQHNVFNSSSIISYINYKPYLTFPILYFGGKKKKTFRLIEDEDKEMGRRCI